MFQVQLRASLEAAPRVSFGNKNLSSRGLFTLPGQLGHFPLDIHTVGPSGCTHSDIPGERQSPTGTHLHSCRTFTGLPSAPSQQCCPECPHALTLPPQDKPVFIAGMGRCARNHRDDAVNTGGSYQYSANKLPEILFHHSPLNPLSHAWILCPPRNSCHASCY